MEETQWTPGKLLGISGSYWQACTLHAGVKLDLFTVLGKAKVGAEEAAKKIGCDALALIKLLNALIAMGLVTKSGNEYSNTSGSYDYLSTVSPNYIGYIIKHHHHLVEGFSKLDTSVMTGKPVRGRASFTDEVKRESFLLGMFNQASNTAPNLVKDVPLSDKLTLLDLGGGPGTYAIYFCLQNPRLLASVYDLATTKPFAESTIKRFNLSDRINFIPGNYLDDPVEGKYDAAWLSHILHAEGFSGCMTIINKAVAALNPGGLLLIHEFILNDTMDGPLFPALFSLNMLIGTPDGQAYSESQIKGMLKDAGLKDIKRLPYKGPNDAGIICGVK
jgi:predicted transcriptional regulator